MTTLPLPTGKPALIDRLFVGGCTVAYFALMAAVAYALRRGG